MTKHQFKQLWTHAWSKTYNIVLIELTSQKTVANTEVVLFILLL